MVKHKDLDFFSLGTTYGNGLFIVWFVRIDRIEGYLHHLLSVQFEWMGFDLVNYRKKFWMIGQIDTEIRMEFFYNVILVVLMVPGLSYGHQLFLEEDDHYHFT